MINSSKQQSLICAWLSVDSKFNSCSVGVDEVDVSDETDDCYCVQIHPTDVTQVQKVYKDGSNGYKEPQIENLSNTSTYIMLTIYSDKLHDKEVLKKQLLEYANNIMKSHENFKNHQINDNFKLEVKA